MMHYRDELPEEIDEQNQHLVKDLRRIYTPMDEEQTLARVRNRLLGAHQHASLTDLPPYQQTAEHGQLMGEEWTNGDKLPIKRRGGGWPRRLSTLAAVLVAAVLVGSLAVVLTNMHNSTPVGAPSNQNASAQPAESSLFSKDWKVLATFKGTDSKTIKGQHLTFSHALAARFTCDGTGDVLVRFNNKESGKGFAGPCQTEVRQYLNYVGAPYTVEQIYITAPANSAWQLQFATCINANACGTTLPTPTAIPPSPVPLTPTPPPVMPPPTMAPPTTAMPTVMPTPTPILPPPLMPTVAPSPAPKHH